MFGFASFRLLTTDSGSAPTMDYAERPFGPGCVSHWSPRTPETIHSHAVPREYTHNIHTHTHTHTDKLYMAYYVLRYLQNCSCCCINISGTKLSQECTVCEFLEIFIVKKCKWNWRKIPPKMSFILYMLCSSHHVFPCCWPGVDQTGSRVRRSVQGHHRDWPETEERDPLGDGLLHRPGKSAHYFFPLLLFLWVYTLPNKQGLKWTEAGVKSAVPDIICHACHWTFDTETFEWDCHPHPMWMSVCVTPVMDLWPHQRVPCLSLNGCWDML